MMGIYEILILVNLLVTVFLIFRVKRFLNFVITILTAINYLLEKDNE